MAGLTRIIAICAKIETTEGSDPMTAPGTADASTQISVAGQPTFTPTEDLIERDLTVPDIGSHGELVGKTSQVVEFETEVMGRGVAIGATEVLQRIDPLYHAVGFNDTVFVASTSQTYPLTGNNKSITLYVYTDPGILKIVNGCRGNLSFTGAAGKVGRYKWRFQGIAAALTSGAFTTGGIQDRSVPSASLDVPTIDPPLLLNRSNSALTLSVHGATTTAVVSSIDWDMGNVLSERTDMANANGQGIAAFLGTKRKINGTIVIEAVQRSVLDIVYKAQAGTRGAITLAVGSAGNKYTFNFPAAQLHTPQEQDQNGVRVFRIPFVATVNSGSGNDEMTVVYS